MKTRSSSVTLPEPKRRRCILPFVSLAFRLLTLHHRGDPVEDDDTDFSPAAHSSTDNNAVQMFVPGEWHAYKTAWKLSLTNIAGGSGTNESNSVQIDPATAATPSLTIANGQSVAEEQGKCYRCLCLDTY